METLVDRLWIGLGYVASAAGAICALFALQGEAFFVIRGPDGTQEYLIGAFGMAAMGAIPSLIGGLAAFIMRHDVTRGTRVALVAPLIMNTVLLGLVFVLDYLAYP